LGTFANAAHGHVLSGTRELRERAGPSGHGQRSGAATATAPATATARNIEKKRLIMAASYGGMMNPS
jgi:hypothetical protein